MGNKVVDFYDDFVSSQAKTGVNKRHRSILAWVQKFGVKKNARILEVGCGIGTFTGLLAEAHPDAAILALDISPKSIEIARERLKHLNNVSLGVRDLNELPSSEPFDLIILPDVLEHIPYDQYGNLFNAIPALLKQDGFLIIHSPDPFYQEWLIENKPELLQIIDLPVHMEKVIPHLTRNRLRIKHLESYTIWEKPEDYFILAITHFPAGPYKEFHPPLPSLPIRVIRKFKSLLGIQ